MLQPVEIATQKRKVLLIRDLTEVELGKFAQAAAKALQESSWDQFFKTAQGTKCMGCRFIHWNHPAVPALSQLQCHGAPVITLEVPWSKNCKDEAVQ